MEYVSDLGDNLSTSDLIMALLCLCSNICYLKGFNTDNDAMWRFALQYCIYIALSEPL